MSTSPDFCFNDPALTKEKTIKQTNFFIVAMQFSSIVQGGLITASLFYVINYYNLMILFPNKENVNNTNNGITICTFKMKEWE